jgi:sialic acid synthase SpsE
MNLFDIISDKIFIIAEIGNNHNGNIETAKRLIDVAVESGVDAVKFQTFRGTDIVSPKVLSSDYPEWNVTEYKYWYEFANSIALPLNDHREVFSYANKKGVIPFSTPTSVEIVDFLDELRVPFYKIASMDITNVQLLEKVASKNKPVIMSTGMAEENDIENAVKFFDINKLVLLHCVSDYPLVYSSANLRSINWLQKRFNCPVGFSDHSLGYDLALAAVALGARVIEKHITLDRNSPQKAEHHFALEPDELKILVKKIRQIEASLGKEEIVISPGEKDLRKKALRSMHLNNDLKEGHILTEEDIAIVRPNDGIEPKYYKDVLGKKLKKNKKSWDPLTKEDI